MMGCFEWIWRASWLSLARSFGFMRRGVTEFEMVVEYWSLHRIALLVLPVL